MTARVTARIGRIGTGAALALALATTTAAPGQAARTTTEQTAAAVPASAAVAMPRPVQMLRGSQAVTGRAGAALSPASAAQARAQVQAAAALSRTDFTPVTPARVIDTRTGLGTPTAKIGPGRTITVTLTGRGGVPTTGVTGVALALTTLNSTASAFLTVYPAGATRPFTRSVNTAAGLNVTEQTIAKVSASGQVTIFNASGSTDVIAYVHGWYGTAPSVHALTPAPLLDTRSGVGAPAKGPLPTGGVAVVQVTGRGGVPATGATGVVVNLTGLGSTTSGTMALFPTGTTPGLGSVVLNPAGPVSNLVHVQLGTGGRVTLINNAATAHALVDVVAWTGPGGQLHPVTPEHRYDTRAVGATGPIVSNGWLDLWMSGFGSIPVLDIRAVVLNVTVVAPATNGSVVVHQQGTARPGAVSLSYTKGRTSTSQVVAMIGAGGWIRFDNIGTSVNFVIDTVGWYSANGSLGLTVGTPVVAGVDGAGQPAPLRIAGESVSGSADGRYTAFIATTQVSPNAGVNGISVRDNLLGITTLVVSGAWRPRGSLSGNGTVMVFTSDDPRLWPRDTNGVTDAYWYDLVHNTFDLVTKDLTGDPASSGGILGGTSTNGRYVVIHSLSLLTGDTGPALSNTFVRDMATGTTVFIGANNASCSCTSPQPVSDDGRIVAYRGSSGEQIVWDRTTRVNRVLSNQIVDLGFSPTVSANGRYVAFPGTSALVAADANGTQDVYALDRTTGVIALVSRTPAGAAGNAASTAASVASDGTVVFLSDATDLVAGGSTRGLYRGTAAGGAVVRVTGSVTSAIPGATDGTAVSYESGPVGTVTHAMVLRLR